jgi:hypothetical protein
VRCRSIPDIAKGTRYPWSTLGALPVVLHALVAHVPGGKVEIIPTTTDVMFEQNPARFSDAVLDFLSRT